jgi:serine/threonine protein kinase
MDINQCPRCRTRFRGEIKVCPVDGEALQRLQDPLLGRTIAGRYFVEDKIGGGGMGVVYRASHQVIGRDVAIKFLHERYMRDATSRKRFLGEARAANQINHENIIDITDFGETEDGLVYLVMEYLQGRSLDQEIAGRPMDAARALRIAIQIAAGLARAHELDVIHRDVKPGNVFLVRKRSDADVVKLLDFGIARFERDARITDRGTLLGTPEYIAPEQIRNGEVSPQTDLYALGCLLFEMLVGQPPFRGNMTEVLVKQMRDPAPTPSTLVPGMAPELDLLVLKMLHKEPRQRHRDAFHLVEELRAQLERLPNGRVPDGKDSKSPPSAAGSQAPRAAAEASLNQPVTDRPTMHMPLERDDWADRIVEYRRRLRALHTDAALPKDVAEAMAALEHSIAETQRLRTALHGSAQQLAISQDEVRATRLRIGRALDELAADESKLSRASEADVTSVSQAQAAATNAVDALLARPSIAGVVAKRGQMLTDDDAVLLQGLSLIVESVRETHGRARKWTREHQTRRAALEDVRFQIQQLKDRLATLNASTSAAQGEVQERVQTVEVKLRSELQSMVSQAERVALYLRSQEDKPGSAKN